MSQIKMLDRPARRVGPDRVLVHAPAKERQLVTELAAVTSYKMPRVIPPFCAKFVVRTMVVGKAIRVPGYGLTENARIYVIQAPRSDAN